MNEELKETFQTAYEFEIKGKEIYESTANSTKNPIIAKTFRYLADQEQLHANEIKEYKEKLDQGISIEVRSDAPEETKRFFSMTVEEFKEKTELTEDDKEAHKVALELEQKAYDFYKEQHEKATDEKLKKFLRFLMTQENTHFELIQKAFEFIKDPAAFYAEEEKWMAEGG
tara:strand:+ start:336 stop:848 length:513 start_codon:yes stop_codon:yes gene_type:complete